MPITRPELEAIVDGITAVINERHKEMKQWVRDYVDGGGRQRRRRDMHDDDEAPLNSYPAFQEWTAKRLHEDDPARNPGNCNCVRCEPSRQQRGPVYLTQEKKRIPGVLYLD